MVRRGAGHGTTSPSIGGFDSGHEEPEAVGEREARLRDVQGDQLLATGLDERRALLRGLLDLVAVLAGHQDGAHVGRQPAVLVGGVDEQHVVGAGAGEVDRVLLTFRDRSVDVVRQGAVVGERDPDSDAGGGGDVLRGLLVGLGVARVLAHTLGRQFRGCLVRERLAFAVDACRGAAGDQADRADGHDADHRPRLDRRPVGEQEGERQQDPGQHGEGEHRVRLRQPQHDAAERVHDDADRHDAGDRELERVGHAAAHVGVVHAVGRGSFRPGLCHPLAAAGEQEDRADDEDRLVRDEADDHRDAAERHQQGPQAVAGGELGGGGPFGDEVGVHRDTLRVAGVDVESGEHTEGDPGGEEPDGARQPVLRGAVHDAPRRSRATVEPMRNLLPVVNIGQWLTW